MAAAHTDATAVAMPKLASMNARKPGQKIRGSNSSGVARTIGTPVATSAET